MAINTNKVEGRRKVRYESYDDLLDDARRHAQGDVRTLGNWSPGQIYDHLARSFDASIDGVDFSLPAPVKWMMSLLMKRKFLTQSLPAGYKSTEKFIPPDATPAEEGLAALERAIERQKQEPNRAPHPAFGNIGREGWNQFNLRHAEMHMSFLINGQEEN